MSTIISPVPVKIEIEFNEVNGSTSYSFSRSGVPYQMPFPQLVTIFCTILNDIVSRLTKAAAAPIPPPPAA